MSVHHLAPMDVATDLANTRHNLSMLETKILLSDRGDVVGDMFLSFRMNHTLMSCRSEGMTPSGIFGPWA